VVDGWANLELHIPRHNGEEFIQDVVHTWIFWQKAHIRIMQQPSSPPTDPPTAMPKHDDQLSE
jgi:hypothetical protein